MSFIHMKQKNYFLLKLSFVHYLLSASSVLNDIKCAWKISVNKKQFTASRSLGREGWGGEQLQVDNVSTTQSLPSSGHSSDILEPWTCSWKQSVRKQWQHRGQQLCKGDSLPFGSHRPLLRILFLNVYDKIIHETNNVPIF